MRRDNENWFVSNNRSPMAVAVGVATVGIALVAIDNDSLFALFVVIVISMICGQLVFLIRKQLKPELFPVPLAQVFRLSSDTEVSAIHEEWGAALEQISARKDAIFREQALERLQCTIAQVQNLSNGTIEFESTETWRIAYEALLRSPGLHLYRSISHVDSVHYWQDGPGQHSTQLNLELHDNRTISVERIAIVANYLWPDDSRFPEPPIHRWLLEQHRHGISVQVVRESIIASEPELLVDVGIYGNRAVGVQTSDASGRTVRFRLSFDFERLQRVENIWDRLAVYATSYEKLLDQHA